MLKFCAKMMLVAMLLCGLLSCNSMGKQKEYTVGIINLNKNLEYVVTSLKKELESRVGLSGMTITCLYNGPLQGPGAIEKEVLGMLNADVDLIVSMTTPVTKKVKKMTRGSKLPVCFVPVFSPETSGIVDSLVKPGGNLTGIKVRGSTGKALEWYVKVVPSAKRVFVPFHHTDKAAIQTLEDLQAAAQSLKIELIVEKLANERQLQAVLASMPNDIDAVWLSHSHLIISNAKKIVTAAAALKKPVISSASQSKQGVMLSYGMSHERIGGQAARMVERLLKGNPPATMPVETADYYLGLNLKMAQAVGVTIPDDVISQADLVIR